MTIDRFPLWVALSLLGFSPVAKADDGLTPPKAPVAAKEEVGAPQALPILGWTHDQELAIFDFDQIPSVLKDLKSPSNSAQPGKFDVSIAEKAKAKDDREIQHYARLYRIWTYESFQHDSQEYRRRITAAQNVLRVWEYEGCDQAHRVALKNWFHQAALASAAKKPLPECEFLDQTLLEQVAQGIEFTANGGPSAGKVFARAMIKGATHGATPGGLVGKALSTPLPFDLPDPATIANPPTTVNANGEPAVEPVPELEITSAEDSPAAAPAQDAAPKQEEPALPTLSP